MPKAHHQPRPVGTGTISEQLPEDIRAQIGRRFPGGYYTAEPYRAWLLADAAADRPHAPAVHPLHAWLATTGGIGITWDEFFAWFGATAADGPMFGEHETVLHRRLRTDRRYRVSGSVVSAVRKRGRAAGLFDLVEYQLELHDDADGGHVATCWNSIVFPRGG
ncbi:hypothetical protein NCCP1664_07910 [Zafaria cholistanensis]|uniref:N-terminal of MaoC-like dehydratase domain-containing protein n=1 Tax=Zafaria cholistanensis TaxID=1682741 RepID=A0A5A7NMX9_9MICC|nr:hypothetical protein [Zafaria cholistanensis]GER22294.1 hypothetical protein NCCP1664_07910 [Zafaria cholistanensis]